MTYKKLTAQEEKQFKQWAKTHFRPEYDAIPKISHPVIKLECLKILAEYLDLFVNPNLDNSYKLEVFTDNDAFAVDKIKG